MTDFCTKECGNLIIDLGNRIAKDCGIPDAKVGHSRTNVAYFSGYMYVSTKIILSIFENFQNMQPNKGLVDFTNTTCLHGPSNQLCGLIWKHLLGNPPTNYYVRMSCVCLCVCVDMTVCFVHCL